MADPVNVILARQLRKRWSNVILDVFDIIFFPVDSVGGLLGLVVQTMSCLLVGAIPGLILRVNFSSVAILYIGIVLIIFSIPFALSIGILVYSVGWFLIGVCAGCAVGETIRQVSHGNRL